MTEPLAFLAVFAAVAINLVYVVSIKVLIGRLETRAPIEFAQICPGGRRGQGMRVLRALYRKPIAAAARSAGSDGLLAAVRILFPTAFVAGFAAFAYVFATHFHP